MVCYQDVVNAQKRIKHAMYESPCPCTEPLSEVADAIVYCKLDYLQRTGSFKERGARNALMMLSDEDKNRGVVAMSAGNHALGLAYHGKLLGIPVTVVAPENAPLLKITTCERFQARVIQHGQNLKDAQHAAQKVSDSEKLVMIPPFDHPDIIAGQGTIALEILEQAPALEAIVVPVGGGGLIAGITTVIKHLRPDVKIYGVEPDGAACLSEAIKAGGPIEIPTGQTLADGLNVGLVGHLPYELVKDGLDGVVTVTEDELALAMLRILELEKGVVEGAGAAGLAALMAGKIPELKGKRVVIPLCGGNVDPIVISRLIHKGLVADGRLWRFKVSFRDQPGMLQILSSITAEMKANIIDIHHERAFIKEAVNHVDVSIVVETRDRDHLQSVRQKLLDQGLNVEDV